jgi:hypothetical protein
LFGDAAAVHGGVGFVVSGCESGPGRQLAGPGESVHVTDLGDEHRSQHRADAGDLLDGDVAGVFCQPAAGQFGEQVDLEIQRLDEPAQ